MFNFSAIHFQSGFFGDLLVGLLEVGVDDIFESLLVLALKRVEALGETRHAAGLLQGVYVGLSVLLSRGGR